MKKLCTMVLAAAMLGFAAPSFAASNVKDIEKIFCDKMEDEELYDQNGFESYKMLVPGKNGWMFRSLMDFRTDFSLTPEALQNLGTLNRALKEKGVDLVMLIIPTRGMMHHEHMLDKHKEQYGFNPDRVWKSYWDSIKAIRNEGLTVVGIKEVPPGGEFFYQGDHHWKAEGSAIGARVVSDYIRTLPSYEDLAKTAFVTKNGSPRDFIGVSKKVFREFCKTEQPSEPIIEKYTERVDEASGQEALFGDSAPPEVVLLGTSNSTQVPSYSNFEGFLKENLSVDILNMSLSGGGLDTAMLSYLVSDHYRNTPAKIAIWELPSYYDISNHMNFFREAIPAAYGVCETPVAHAAGVPVDEKATIVLSKLVEKHIQGGNYYLHLNFSERVTQPFIVTFNYRRAKDSYRFAPLEGYPRSNEFFLSLDPGKESELDKIVIRVPKGVQGGTVEARICPQAEVTAFADIVPRTESRKPPKAADGFAKFFDHFKKL